MNGSYAFALFLSAIASLALSGIAWKRRNAPGGKNLIYLGIAIAIWASSYGVHWLALDPGAKRFWLNLAYMGATAVPFIFLTFCLRYTSRGYLLKVRMILLLAVEPVLAAVMIWTDPWHALYFGGKDPNHRLILGGILFWIHTLYSYSLLGVSAILLLRTYFSTIRALRSQVTVMLLGALLPWFFNLVSISKWNPFPSLDLTPFAFTLTAIFVAIGLSQYRLLDIAPMARSVLFEKMMDFFVVLDKQNRVVDINTTALRMLDKESLNLIGKTADELFSNNRPIFERFRDTLITHQEICLTGPQPIYLDLQITPLYDSRGKYSGRIIVGRDITSRKLAILAEHEQRVLAEALREIAGVLSNSRTFSEVLDCLLDNAGRVVPHDIAIFMMLDEYDVAHATRVRGFTEHGLKTKEKFLHMAVSETPNLTRMIQTGQALVVPDTQHDENWVVVQGMEKLASYVGAPVRVKGKVVGFLDLHSLISNYYNQSHADRLQIFADQAAIAIENTRLIEEAQHRAEEMTTLIDIGLTITSGLTMDQILITLLKKCQQILPVEAFYVAVYDAESEEISHPLFYDRGVFRETPVRDIRQQPGLSGQVIQTSQTLYIPDTFAKEVTDQFQIMHAGGDSTRSYVGVPMVFGDRVVGVISMQSYRTNAYNPAQIRLLEAIATQAAVAIENAHLLEEARRRAEEMAALFDIGVTISSGLEMDRTLRTLLEKCQQVLPVEAFYVAVLDPDTSIIHHPLAYDLGEFPEIPDRDLRKTPGVSGNIINTRQTLYIPDMLAPEAIHTYQIFRTSGKPTRSFVGVPMIVGDQVAGVISMQSYKPNAYDPGQIRLLETISTQAAGAIENSRLYHKLQQELGERAKAEHRYRALFEQSHDAVFILDFTGKHLEVNQRASGLLGYTAEEILQMTASDISDQKEDSENVMKRLLNGDHVPLYERVVRKKNGEKVITEINVELVRDETGAPLHVQSVVRDITQRKVDEEALKKANSKLRRQIVEIKSLQTQLREQATRDALTDLFNRRYLEETLEREFAEAKRQVTTVCLVMMDIDGFKGFNDTHGHDAGDYLLKELGKLLQNEIRRSDIACRFGGEEFVIVMPGAPLERGVQRAEQLRLAFETGNFEYMQEKLNATLSLGVAVYPKHGDSWEQVLHAADRAMYLAKDAGRNCTRSAGD